jgi:hypothetical protein
MGLATTGVACLVAVVLIGVRPAAADIVIVGVDRTSGTPGEPVELLVGCGGCRPGTVLPVSLLPAGDSPGRHPCRRTSCAPTAPAPPAEAPYVSLGTAVPLHGGARLAHRLGIEIPDSVSHHGPDAIRGYVASSNRLRFRIPDAEPGLYTYVIFCCGLAPPEGGSLIGHPQVRPHRNRSRLAHALRDGEFLRIEPGPVRAGESSGLPWPVWIAISGVGLLAVLALLRRRPAP